MAERGLSASDPTPPVSAEDREAAARFLDAFERYDMDAMADLLHEDATLSMPPYALWLEGPVDIVGWMAGPGHGCRDSYCIRVDANGTLAFAQYRPNPSGDGYHPWALQVLETRSGKVTAVNSFLDTEVLFPLFDLPDVPPV
jgi:RNA polymerase sigma-70 factor (ECF subfamily)